MSLKPGIGSRWLQKFQTDVYPHDYVIVRGKEMKPPKYYDRLFSQAQPDSFEEVQYRRELDARARYEDNTQDRLVVKEQVARAAATRFSRKEF